MSGLYFPKGESQMANNQYSHSYVNNLSSSDSFYSSDSISSDGSANDIGPYRPRKYLYSSMDTSHREKISEETPKIAPSTLTSSSASTQNTAPTKEKKEKEIENDSTQPSTIDKSYALHHRAVKNPQFNKGKTPGLSMAKLSVGSFGAAIGLAVLTVGLGVVAPPIGIVVGGLFLVSVGAAAVGTVDVLAEKVRKAIFKNRMPNPKDMSLPQTVAKDHASKTEPNIQAPQTAKEKEKQGLDLNNPSNVFTSPAKESSYSLPKTPNTSQIKTPVVTMQPFSERSKNNPNKRVEEGKQVAVAMIHPKGRAQEKSMTR